ncbi:MAG: porin [Castellaniella sp.]|uniref:porin n=1 Tax=Castellaniella sp. TaxID=1955812 RepID=UPI002A36A23A|nr:porin [Castellaniella sp.]MDY0310126.1 porin [Castellaniella sp.]
MKKTLLAAALLAGFATAGVAQAETSVTLYGIVDTGYGYQNYKYDRNGIDATSKTSGLRSGTVNGNRFGLKGSEDLGDGLRAIFQLEQGFDLGNGQGSSGRQFHRQAFVGLSSDNWGTFTMGRQYSAGVMVGDLIVNGWNMGDADKVFGAYGYANRIDNSFKYVTPDLSGFKAAFLYGSGGNDTINRDEGAGVIVNSERDSRVSVGLMYANGPISAGASYDRQGNTANEDAITNWTVNAGYDFEVVKLSLAYGRDRYGKLGWAGGAGEYVDLGANNPVLSNDFKSNNYHVGLSAPIGGGTLYAGWGYSTSNLDDSDKWGDDAGNISTYQLNYFYPLSKRTGVYTYATYGKNLGYVKDLKGTEAGIGLNHKF